jgi:hypothetical protein
MEEIHGRRRFELICVVPRQWLYNRMYTARVPFPDYTLKLHEEPTVTLQPCLMNISCDNGTTPNTACFGTFSPKLGGLDSLYNVEFMDY